MLTKKLTEVIDIGKIDNLETAHELAWAALETLFPERGAVICVNPLMYHRGTLNLYLDETDRGLAAATPVAAAWGVAALAEAARILGVTVIWEQPEDCSQEETKLVHLCGTSLDDIPGAICPVCGYDTGAENCVVAGPGE